ETINDYDDFINTLETIFHQSCAAKNINFDFRKDNLNKIIKVDRLRLNQIFFNILSNSIKFTPEGGTVSFRTDNLQLFPTYFEEDLIIQDTGIGMSEAFMKHLFHPFEQEDTSYSSNLKGTGLGLSIAKTLVELMGGTIKIESKQNIGTTVLIHLAFKLATEAEIRKTGSLKQINYDETKLQNRHILLAEDHPLNAQIAIKLLEKKGIIVTHCENGQAAVEAFKKSEPDYFDIILMDIRMPIMDGLEATKEIRKLDHPNSKTIPIIAMTANAYDEDINQTRDAGMNYHLSKPIQTDLLYQTLIKALKK
ncbi:MAG: response regulator, partial [Bacilli bacterium]